MNLETFLGILEMGVGAFAASFLNDTYVTPNVEQLIPELQSDHLLSKVQDTATMGALSVGLGKVGRVLGLHRAARALETGGLVVTGMKALSIPFSGLEVKTTVPNPLSLFRAAQAAAPAPRTASTAKQLPAAGATSGSASGASALPAVPTGVPSSYIVSGISAQTSSNLSTGY